MGVRRGIDRKKMGCRSLIGANLEGQVGVNKFQLYLIVLCTIYRLNCLSMRQTSSLSTAFIKTKCKQDCFETTMILYTSYHFTSLNNTMLRWKRIKRLTFQVILFVFVLLLNCSFTCLKATIYITYCDIYDSCFVVTIVNRHVRRGTRPKIITWYITYHPWYI